MSEMQKLVELFDLQRAEIQRLLAEEDAAAATYALSAVAAYSPSKQSEGALHLDIGDLSTSSWSSSNASSRSLGSSPIPQITNSGKDGTTPPPSEECDKMIPSYTSAEALVDFVLGPNTSHSSVDECPPLLHVNNFGTQMDRVDFAEAAGRRAIESDENIESATWWIACLTMGIAASAREQCALQCLDELEQHQLKFLLQHQEVLRKGFIKIGLGSRPSSSKNLTLRRQLV